MAGTVIVGCKLPNGLVLRVGDESVRVAGTARYSFPNASRKIPNPTLVHGDSLTMVDKDLWTKWLEKHKDAAVVRKGYIYASNNENDARARASETKGIKTGFEPLDPEQPRLGIEPTEESKSALRETSARATTEPAKGQKV